MPAPYVEEAMVANKLQTRASLLHRLMSTINTERLSSTAAKKRKPKPIQDDDYFFENATKEVLIEYYKNLGRGPI